LEYVQNNKSDHISKLDYINAIETTHPYFEGMIGLHLSTIDNGVSFLKESNERLLIMIDLIKTAQYYFEAVNDTWLLTKILINDQEHPVNNERFENFIQRFLKYENFRLERTVMPLKAIEYNLGEHTDTSFIQQSDINRYINNWLSVFITYDNYNMKRPDLQKVYLTYTGGEGGTMYGYVFEILNGKWFLDQMWGNSN
jgi:hypothetical protein